MDVKFKSQKTYISEAEYMYDLAKSTQSGTSQYKFDDDEYNYLMQQGDEKAIENYVYAVANAKNLTSSTFSERDYKYLSAGDKANYFINEFYGDKDSEEYQQNKLYFNQQVERGIAQETYNNLSTFSKVANSIGVMLGNAANAVYGTIEGVLDVGLTLTGAITAAVLPNYTWDDAKQFVARDLTGTRAISDALQDAAMRYTYLDKNAVWKTANDVASGLTAMAPMLIPVAGTGIYFTAMAGNTASEAIIANPDIDFASLLAYTATVTGVEFATEKLSGFILGGAGSAIDRAAFGVSSKPLTKLGQFASKHWIAKVGLNFLSEGLEESISEFADTVLYNAFVWQGREDVERKNYSLQDILYAGLIGGLIGGLTEGVSIASTKAATIGGKKLTKLQTRVLSENITNAESVLDKSAVADLQAKYNMTEEMLKSEHLEEYEKAVKQDKQLYTDVTNAVVGLSKIYEMIGPDEFQKTMGLVNETIANKRKLLQNYVNMATGKTVENRIIETKFAAMNKGASVKIADDLNVMETRLQKSIKNMYGIDVYFGDFGTENGYERNFNTVLDNNTIVIDRSYSSQMTPQRILNSVVKTGLVESLIKDAAVLGKQASKDLRSQLSSLTEEEVDLTESSDIAKAQIKAIAEAMLFDKLTVSRVFLTNNSVFNGVYRHCRNIKEDIENKRLFRTEKGKLQYNTILKTMKMYRDVVGDTIGNNEDLDIASDSLKFSTLEYKDIFDDMIPNDNNAHYVLLKGNFTTDSVKRQEAMLALNDVILGQRTIESFVFKPNYNKIFDSDYYNKEFVTNVMSIDPQKDFRYNLQEYFIKQYGFTISQQDNCLLEVMDYNLHDGKKYVILNNNLDTDLFDLQANPDSMADYTMLSQLFNDEFNAKFNGRLDGISLEFIETEDANGIQAIYSPMKSIQVYKPVGLMTQSQIIRLKDDLLHEVTHALADFQGLSNGTSSRYVKSCLLNEPNDTVLQKLAKLLCTNEFYQANKTSRDVLIDAVSFGVYRITDGEYAAEAYAGSVTRRGEADVLLKAGYTMNRSGFIMTPGTAEIPAKLTGYGKFSGITLTTPELLATQPDYEPSGLRRAGEVVAEQRREAPEGLRPAEEVVQDTKEGITKWFNNINIRGKGFNTDFVKQIRNGDISQLELYQAIYDGKIGSNTAANYVLSAIAGDNKYLKTVEDLRWLIDEDGLIKAYAYGMAVHKPRTAVNRQTIEDFVNSAEGQRYYKSPEVVAELVGQKAKIDPELQGLISLRDLLQDVKTDTLTKKLITMDFSNSFSDVRAALDIVTRKESAVALDQQIGEGEDSETLSDIIEDEASNVEEITLEDMREAGYNVDDVTDIINYRDEQASNAIKTIKNALKSGDIETVTREKYKRQISLTMGVLEYREVMINVKNKTHTPQQAREYFKDVIDENYPRSEITGLTGWERNVSAYKGQPAKQKASIMNMLGKIWWKENIQPLIDSAKGISPKETVSKTRKELSKEAIHYGTLQTAKKAEPLGTGLHETGGFGTGTYFMSSLSKDTTLSNRTKNVVDISSYNTFNPKTTEEALQLHEYLKDFEQAVLTDTENYEFIDDLSKILNVSDVKLLDILTDAQERYSKYVTKEGDSFQWKTNKLDDIYDVDKPQTYLMKRLGYEGINVLGLSGVDNSKYGSVIFDLKQIARKAPEVAQKTEVTPEKPAKKPAKVAIPEEGQIKLELIEEPVKSLQKIEKRMKKAITTGEQVTIGDILAETTGDENLKTEPTINEEVETYTTILNTVEQASQEEAKEGRVEESDAESVSNSILNLVTTTAKKLSKMQLTKATELEYNTVSASQIASPVFEAVTERNYDEVRKLISGNPTALEVFDQAMTMITGANANEKFSQEFVDKVQNISRETTTAGAQRTALQNAILKQLRPVTNMVQQLHDAGYDVNVTEDIISKYDERLKNKDAVIKQYEKELADLKQRIKDNANNELEQSELAQELFEKTQALSNLKSKDPLAILDWLINNVESFEGLNESQKKLNQMLTDFLDMAQKSKEADKELGFYLKDKNGELKSFPKAREWLYKMLKSTRNFRMWAMTSSPVSWIRNTIGNLGMTVMDKATNIVERQFTKQFQQKEIVMNGVTLVPSDSVKFNESKAGKEVYDHISKTQGVYIKALIHGETKYGTDEGKVAASRELRQREIAEANGFRKFFLKAQDINDWGLERGPLGDERFVYSAICRNMGNLVASSKDYLMNGIRAEYETLDKLEYKDKLTDAQKVRYNLCKDAMRSGKLEDIFDAIHPSEMKQLMESCKARAFEQYFKNPNKLSKWMSNLANKNPIAAELMSWVLPFPKVASNIMCMATRYSPLGVINAISNLSKARLAQADVSGQFDAHVYTQKAIRNLAEASVGTVSLLAGALLAALGWVDIDDDDYQGLSLKMGDVRIGLSDMAPSLTTFSTAAAFVYGWKNNKGAFKQALNTLYDNTLLGNLENVFKYSTPEAYMSNLSISYFSQYIPAVIKATNRLTNNQAYIDKTGGYFTKLGKTLLSYVPVVSSLLPKKINPYTGKPMTATGSTNWWFNLLATASPLGLQYKGVSGIEAEAVRLGVETSGLSGSFKITSNADDYDIKLTDKTKQKYAESRAEYINYLYDKIVSGKETVKIQDQETGKYKEVKYSDMTDKEKAKVLSNIYSQATTMVKVKYWTDKGHSYYVTNQDDYNTYSELFKNIQYKTKWSGSKFIE